MKILFHRDPEGNFGDDINHWIWDVLLPGWQNWCPDVTLVGVGTLLNQKRLNPYRNSRLLVVGTGVGYGSGPPQTPYPSGWDFRAVRGPLSADLLGLPRQFGLLDPATMIADFPEFRDIAKSGKPAFIPHSGSMNRHDWDSACAAADLTLISPRLNSHTVIRRIVAAPFVFTEAMHGAIIADAFRVPFIPLQIGPRFNQFKWKDWAASLQMSFEIPNILPNIDQVFKTLAPKRGERWVDRMRVAIERRLIVSALGRHAKRKPILSETRVLEKKKGQYKTVLEEILRDYS